jgi:hypothetical protein
MDSPLITAHDLRLLSIGYYIQAAVAGFSTLLLLGYSAIATVILANVGKIAGESSQQPIPPAFLSILSVIFFFLIAFVAAFAVCLFLAGYWLRRLRNKLFIQIMAGFSCLSLPYGTVLGVFTFMVLVRPSAKQLFAGTATPPPLPGPPSPVSA